MGFESCHPMVNLIYFSLVISGTIIFNHPIFLGISFLCGVVYSVKRCGRKTYIFTSVLILLVIIYGFYYSSYNHFGLTILKENMIGNSITMESFVYGIVRGIKIAGLFIWLSCVYSVFTSDKIVYLFGRISPKMSLFLSILLRLFPRLKLETKRINRARMGIGRGVNQGNVFKRIKNIIAVLSILITWFIDAIGSVIESMKNRGSALKGRKAFSIYRFDNRDRTYVIVMFANITIVLVAIILKQTDIIYNPRIIVAPITTMSYIFYISYGLFCIMPLLLEIWVEYSFYKSKKKNFGLRR